MYLKPNYSDIILIQMLKVAEKEGMVTDYTYRFGLADVCDVSTDSDHTELLRDTRPAGPFSVKPSGLTMSSKC